MNSNDAVREAANLADRSTFEERAQFVADGDAITLWPLPFSEQTAGRDKRENTTCAQLNQLPYIDGT